MNCEEFQNRLREFRKTVDQDSLDLRLHAGSCVRCASRLSALEWVEIWPALDQSIEPSEEFSARFHTRLKQHQNRQGALQRTRPWWGGFVAWGWPKQVLVAGSLAAILGAGIFLGRYPGQRNATEYRDFAVAENLPLLQDMDVVNNLDLLEDFEIIENLPAGPSLTR